jgi:hypothetical protein
MVVLTAPIYSLLVCILSALVVQFYGHALLLLGIAIVITVPWAYVGLRDVYITTNWTLEKQGKASIAQYAIMISTIIGYGLIFIWFIYEAVQLDPILGYDETVYVTVYPSEIVRLILDTPGRLCVTTIMFSDILLQIITKENVKLYDDHENDENHNEQAIKFQAYDSAFTTNRPQRTQPTVEQPQQQQVNERNIVLANQQPNVIFTLFSRIRVRTTTTKNTVSINRCFNIMITFL